MSATNRGSVRRKDDYYPTPYSALEPLFQCIRWEHIRSFLEPCRGDGSIYDHVPIENKEYCEIQEEIDYFSYVPLQKFDLIVTNPPYRLAQEFVSKSLVEARTVCYLLRLNFLGSQKRKEWWNHIGTPNKLIVLSHRPKFINNKTDATEYAWFIWDHAQAVYIRDGIHVI